MKHTKRILSLCAVSALLLSLFAATGLLSMADTTYAPPYHNDNYTVVRNFTEPNHGLYEGAGTVASGLTKVTSNAEDASLGTPSPDGAAAHLYIGGWSQNQYGFTGLNFSGAESAEAIALWYKFPFDATLYAKFTVGGKTLTPTVVNLSGANPVTTVTELVTVDGSTDYYALLAGEGYVIITAEDLAANDIAIESITAIDAFGRAVQPWLNAASHWYADDIGYVKDLDAFISDICGIPVVDTVSDKGLWSTLYDDNVTVINDFTTAAQLPQAWWGQAQGAQLAKTSGTISPDGLAAALPLGEDGTNSFHLNGDFSKAAGAEALAFWYYIPSDGGVVDGYFKNAYINVTATEGRTHNWAPAYALRYGSFFNWPTGPVNFTRGTWGYFVIKLSDLAPDQAGVEAFDLTEITDIALANAAWTTNVGGCTMFIDDLMAIKDVAAFNAKVEALMTAYTVTVPDGVVASKTAGVYPGETITLTLPANAQLKAGSLTVQCGEGAPVKVLAKGDTAVQGEGSGVSFSFVMPAGNATVAATLIDPAQLTAKDNVATLAASTNAELKALRFLTRLYLNDGKLVVGGQEHEIVEYGTLILPQDLLGSAELTLDTPAATKIPAAKLIDKTAEYVDFTGGLRNLKSGNLGRAFSARAYVQYKVGEEIVTVYTDTVSASYNAIAQQ